MSYHPVEGTASGARRWERSRRGRETLICAEFCMRVRCRWDRGTDGVGSREICAAVPPDRDGETVRCFATFTPDLHALPDWLAQCGVDTVALESTGPYWIPAFEILEA